MTSDEKLICIKEGEDITGEMVSRVRAWVRESLSAIDDCEWELAISKLGGALAGSIMVHKNIIELEKLKHTVLKEGDNDSL